MARTAAPQVPGEAPAAAPAEKPADDLVGDPAAPEGGEVAALRAELAQLKQMMAGLVSARAAPVPNGKNATPENLPDQTEVDPAKIERPVLSKQGWVVPHGFGSPPAAARMA